MNDSYSHCPRCGRALATGGCLSCGWPNAGALVIGHVDLPAQGLDTGDVHRAPLLARIAALEEALKAAEEYIDCLESSPSKYGDLARYDCCAAFDTAVARCKETR